MQQVICVRAFSHLKPGDLAEMPDGAEFSDLYFAVADSAEGKAAAAQAAAAKKAAAPAPPPPPATPAAAGTSTPKAGA